MLVFSPVTFVPSVPVIGHDAAVIFPVLIVPSAAMADPAVIIPTAAAGARIFSLKAVTIFSSFD